MFPCEVLRHPKAKGAFLNNHQNYQQNGKNSQQDHCPCWKKCLFAVHSPFMMDSQAERIRREAVQELSAELKETSAQRKRRKKSSLARPISDGEAKIVRVIKEVLPLLVERAREMKLLTEVMYALRDTDNNRSAREAATITGCGDIFHNLSCEMNEQAFSDSAIISFSPRKQASYKASDVIGVLAVNSSDHYILAEVEGHKFVIPAKSRFLTSSFYHMVSQGFSSLSVETGYDLIVVDPPWINKSVKRKKSYYTLTEGDLCHIPVARLCRHGGLVCVWVTNNARLLDFVREQLFPAWSVRWLANWVWVKVTLTGELVSDLTSTHKKPYEQIIIGRYEDSQGERMLQTPTEQGMVNWQNGAWGNSSSLSAFDTGDEDSCLPGETSRTDKPKLNCTLTKTETSFGPSKSSNKPIGVSTPENMPGPDGSQELVIPVTVLDSVKCCTAAVDVHAEQDLDPSPGLNSNLDPGPSFGLDPVPDPSSDLEPVPSSDLDPVPVPSSDLDPDVQVESHRGGVDWQEIPDNFIVMSVPCALHSKKPSLGEVLQPYLPARPQCLELFARNLNPGWTSWGDEPLCHQHIDYFEDGFKTQGWQGEC